MSHGAPVKKSDDDDELQEPGIPPPDGGWGWVVVFASFMIHIVTDGVTYSFGVFYLQFLNYFESGKGETAWIVSILVGVTYCSGPIASSFVNKYGCRPVTIAGAILAALSLMVSVFAKNIFTLYITIGFGTGFGLGLIYLPAIVSVTMYFEKKRSLATGIAVCGSGFGTFIFAPIIEWMNQEYGWKGAILITGALILNCIIFGALFRPLEDGNKRELSVEVEDDIIKTKDQIELHSSNPTITQTETERPRSMGHYTIPRPSKLNGTPNENGTQRTNGTLKSSDKVRLALSQPLLASDFGSQNISQPTHVRKSVGVMSRPDILYQGSLMNIPQYRSKNDLNRDLIPLTTSHKKHTLSTTSIRHSRNAIYADTVEIDPNSSSCFCCTADTKETIKEMLDLSLFRDVVFLIFALSNFCTSIGFNIPYVYIVPKAATVDISKTDASYLISIIGMANTIGRIILGYLSDKPWVNRLMVYNVCLTICGTATFLSAFCYDFVSLAIYASVFGFTIGAYVGLTSVILVDLLGLEKLTNAFGLLLLFQGIASLIGPPLAGFLYDILGSYDPGFYLSGVSLAVSGVMLFVIPSIQRLVERRKENSIEDI